MRLHPVNYPDGQQGSARHPCCCARLRSASSVAESVTAPMSATAMPPFSSAAPSLPSVTTDRIPSSAYVTGFTRATASSDGAKTSIGANVGARNSSGKTKKMTKPACAAEAGGAREGVAVGVEGHLGRGVAEQGPGGADVDAAGDGEGGRRVPEVVETDLPDSRPGKRPLEPVQGCLGVQVVAVLAAEDEVEVMPRRAGLVPFLQLALAVGAGWTHSSILPPSLASRGGGFQLRHA